MNKNLTKALQSPEMKTLQGLGLKVVSTDRQLQNGTIALTGKIRRQPVSYKVTATGAVLSNEFVARRVTGDTEYKLYKAGLKAAVELAERRVAR